MAATDRRTPPTWIYDATVTVFSYCLDIFFREVYPRGAWRIPKDHALLLVGAPHANQFVDSLVLMHILKKHAARRVYFVIAAKSLKELFIGRMSAAMGSISVVRATNHAEPGPGQIYCPDLKGHPTLLRGRGVDFGSSQFMKGGLIVLPVVGVAGPEQTTIAEVLGPDTVRVREPFSAAAHECLRNGTPYKIAPHFDNSDMYEEAWRKLADDECVGIFPEGGSHDRPSLLPFKAGVAVIALGAL